MKSKPKPCGCGCGGMTKGGRYLPGHDAKLKGRLKREARSGDVASFERLVEIGWAAPSERIDYLGNGAAYVGAAYVGAVSGPVEIGILPDDRNTPAGRLKAEMRLKVRPLYIPGAAFDRMWNRAMRKGWPDPGNVRKELMNQATMYRDIPTATVRDTTHQGDPNRKRKESRQGPCRECGHKWLRYVSAELDNETWECEACHLLHAYPARRLDAEAIARVAKKNAGGRDEQA